MVWCCNIYPLAFLHFIVNSSFCIENNHDKHMIFVFIKVARRFMLRNIKLQKHQELLLLVFAMGKCYIAQSFFSRRPRAKDALFYGCCYCKGHAIGQLIRNFCDIIKGGSLWFSLCYDTGRKTWTITSTRWINSPTCAA